MNIIIGAGNQIYTTVLKQKLKIISLLAVGKYKLIVDDLIE